MTSPHATRHAHLPANSCAAERPEIRELLVLRPELDARARTVAARPGPDVRTLLAITGRR